MRHSSRSWLAALGARVALAALCPAFAQAQPAPAPADPAALRVVTASPNGPTTEPVTQATVRFSEPMVPLAAADGVERPDYVRVEPDVAVAFRWADTNVLVVQPAGGRFPHATRITIHVDGRATAVSGRRLGDAMRFTFETPAPRLLTGAIHADDSDERPTRIDLTFDQPVRDDDAASRIQVTLEPPVSPLPALSAAARAYLAQVDATALAAHDAWARDMRAAVGTARPLPFTVAHRPQRDTTLEVTLAEPLPPGGQVVVRATGIGSPEGPLRGDVPDRHVASSGTLFAMSEARCAGRCEPADVSLSPTRVVQPEVLRAALRVVDITRPTRPEAVSPGPMSAHVGWRPGLEALGFTLTPGHRYAIRVDAGLTAQDGARLPAPWCAVVDVGLPSSLSGFGTLGPAVWEARLGRRLPLLTRSLVDVRGGAVAVAPEAVVPALRAMADRGGWKAAPTVPRTVTRVPGKADGRVREVLVDVGSALPAAGTGLVWASYPQGREIDGVPDTVTVRPRPYLTSTLVQVTNIGLTVRGSAERLAILASALDTGHPIAAADVTVLDAENRVLWRGATDRRGLAEARLDGTPYVVLARTAADVAFVAVPQAFAFGHGGLVGVLFTDRALYRPGETAHVRAFVQEPRADGPRRLAPGTAVTLTLLHEGETIATHRGTLDAVGGVEWTMPIVETAKPDDEYRLELTRDEAPQSADSVECSLLIKAFRPAEFRVDVGATGVLREVQPAIDATVAAHDLSEVALGGAPFEWAVTREPSDALPEVLRHDREFQYATWHPDVETRFANGDIPPIRLEGRSTLGPEGQSAFRVELPEGFAGRGAFTVAAQVRDASSRVIGSEVVVQVPADVYLGVAADTSAMPAEAAVRIVARRPSGEPVAGIDLDVRIEGHGGKAVVLPATTATTPVRVVLPNAVGWVVVGISARRGPLVVTPVSASFAFEAPGPSAPAPLTLTLDRDRYQPGATARLRIASDWREATALVTLERGGLLHAEVVRLADGVATLELPVGTSPAAGLLAAVTLVRGRTAPCCARGLDDPGRPASISETVDVPIDRTAARLAVSVEAPADVQSPATPARIRVRVRDAAGRPAAGRVTLWAVDEGVLGLAGYMVADPFELYDHWIWKAWRLSTADSRDHLLARRLPELMRMDYVSVSSASRSTAPPGRPPLASPQVASGGEPVVRRDLRPLAYWFGALDTDADGVAEASPVLPDTLTTYRVMAIAADSDGRYGTATTPLVVAKRLMVRPALPRVLTRNDRPRLRAIVASRDLAGDGTVLIESLTPDLLGIESRPQPITVAPAARAVAAVDAVARAAGTARIRVTATVAGARDVIERDVPIADATIRETTAAFGETTAREAVETLRPPEGVDPSWGGLEVEVASTLLVGLAASGQYVNDYRYFCAEQVASRALLLTLAPDLGSAFVGSLGLGDRTALKARTQAAIDALDRYRCDGRYGYWAGSCGLTSPALTAYVLHVLQTAARRGFTMNEGARNAAARALAGLVATPMPTGPTYSDGPAVRAFAVKVLADAGQRPTRAIDAVYAARADLPVFALAHLMDAMHTLDPQSPRLAELRRLIGNAMTPAGATAHVAERWRPEDVWLWPSTDKSTAIVLDVLTRAGALTIEEARPLVAGLMQRRKEGLWSGTQGNVWVLAGLATYRRAFEASGVPVTATATLAATPLVRATLSPSDPTVTRAVPMPELRTFVGTGKRARLAIGSSGPQPVFYATRLRWQRPAAGAPPLDHGIAVTRSYARLVHDTPQRASTRFAAGDLVRVTLTVRVPEQRSFVAVTDPLPAGFEPVDASLEGAGHEAQAAAVDAGDTVWSFWRSGFDHLQRYDDRVDLFATSLPAGEHSVSYLARATTPGTFYAAPARAELMYEPEVAGRAAGVTITVD